MKNRSTKVKRRQKDSRQQGQAVKLSDYWGLLALEPSQCCDVCFRISRDFPQQAHSHADNVRSQS
jgi:hypothetical protein